MHPANAKSPPVTGTLFAWGRSWAEVSNQQPRDPDAQAGLGGVPDSGCALWVPNPPRLLGQGSHDRVHF